MANSEDNLIKSIANIFKKTFQSKEIKEVSSEIEKSVNKLSTSNQKVNQTGIGECTIFQW